MKTILCIDNLHVQTYIGCEPWEQEKQRSLYISIRLEGDTDKALETDTLSDTIDYVAVADMVTTYCSDTKHELLEHLGASIIERCFSLPHDVSYVRISIKKKYLALELDAVGVEMEERR